MLMDEINTSGVWSTEAWFWSGVHDYVCVSLDALVPYSLWDFPAWMEIPAVLLDI